MRMYQSVATKYQSPLIFQKHRSLTAGLVYLRYSQSTAHVGSHSGEAKETAAHT